MKASKATLVGLCLIALALASGAQRRNAQAQEDAVNITSSTGTFVVNFTITVKSTVPSTDIMSCIVTASAFDTSGASFTETASYMANRAVSPATCKVTIPYSWALASPSSDKVSFSYSVGTQTTSTPTAGELLIRSAQGTLAPFAVPSTGSTTTKSISVTF